MRCKSTLPAALLLAVLALSAQGQSPHEGKVLFILSAH